VPFRGAMKRTRGNDSRVLSDDGGKDITDEKKRKSDGVAVSCRRRSNL